MVRTKTKTMNTTTNTTMNRGLTVFKLKRKRCSIIAGPRYSGPGTSRPIAAADTSTVATSTIATSLTCTTATATNSTSTSALDRQVANRVREEKKVKKRYLGLGIEPEGAVLPSGAVDSKKKKRKGTMTTGAGSGTGILESKKSGGSMEAGEVGPRKRLRRRSRNQNQGQRACNIQDGVDSDTLNMETIDTSRRGDTDTLDLSATSEKTLVDVGQDESHSGETRANGSGGTSKSGVFLSSSRFSKTSLICGCTCTTHEKFDDSTSHGLDIIGTLKRRLYGSCAQLVASRAREREVQKRLEVQEWKFGIMKKRYEKVRKDNELLMKRVEELKKLEGNRKRRMEEVIEEEQEKLVVEILLEVD